MPKLSPKREKKEEKKEEKVKNTQYITPMRFYILMVAAAVASVVVFIVYASQVHIENVFDDFEGNYAKAELSAYGGILALLFAVLMLLVWIGYNTHRLTKHFVGEK